MLDSIYDLPETELVSFLEKETVIRKQHELVMLFSECDECFDRYEVRGEPRSDDGYICPLNDVAYCECDPEGPAGLGVDADHWDCPVYLKAVEELRSEFGVTDSDS